MIKIKDVMIHQYKCLKKEQKFQLEKDITVLVGQNEAGKTCILEALAKANYFDRGDKAYQYDPVYDYPRWRKRELDRQKETPLAVTLTYEVSEILLGQIQDVMILQEMTNTFSRITDYQGRHQIVENGFDYDPHCFWEAYVSQKDPRIRKYKKALACAYTKEDWKRLCEKAESREEEKALKKLEPFFENRHHWENPLNEFVFRTFLLPNIPKFMFYDEFYMLPSRISLDKLKKDDPLTPAERTAKAFLMLADIDLNKINPDEFENYKTELETTQARITNELLHYWKNNQNLRIVFDIIREPVAAEPEKQRGFFFRKKQKQEQKYQTWLEVRVQNLKTMVSLPLENRSRGFNWFFSFFVWFKAIQKVGGPPYVLLLDEPGLNLHTTAQNDLLHLIHDLSNEYQILFTTHSEHMMDKMKKKTYCVEEDDEGSRIYKLTD
ncbi:MAG: AAA family ATPase [Lachnospiraceae bacterium]|nr:AAA family ATPase [Lachnospiraceae bacterium]